jgi:3-hydroxybutyryl-CoA dehydrogenase
MTAKLHVAIAGAGLMGHGLALVFVAGGHSVSITDPVPDVLKTVKVRIAATLKSLDKDESAVDRVAIADSLGDAVRDADIVIEAAPEKLALKQSVFAELERHASPQALLASNTSAIPIGQIAARVTSKHRVLGTHWWNPPYLVPLVEVIQAEATDPQTITQMIAVLKDLGKVPVHVKKDVTGFVGNRLQHALWREAIALVADGVCDAETVDLVVKNSFGRRLAVLGPLENADLVGTDLTKDIHENVLAHLDCSKSPNPYLNALVREGKLGFKSNEGFMTWTEDKKSALQAAVLGHLRTLNQLLGT